ncbi:hypothetical protein F511_42120 [Dorcoceras hygrometricum]|uniref:Uncharacterized protein n=1 Tax=Dorcoceras hygrometricum TaxID=472368 RepID=A0A2Z7BUS2_9LAMI|nr:hypothetical protein F511_42120 [Dorcoceras hygrometricum]
MRHRAPCMAHRLCTTICASPHNHCATLLADRAIMCAKLATIVRPFSGQLSAAKRGKRAIIARRRRPAFGRCARPARNEDPDPASRGTAEKKIARETINTICNSNTIQTIHRVFALITLLATRAWLQPELQERRLFTVGGGRFVNQVHDRKRSPSDQPALED